MALYQYGSSSKVPPPVGRTEFEILKASHKFLREEDDKNLSWDEKLASKYYASLYREFAVCNLKHYKSGNFALRWRTEAEVLSGAGETTCGNTRCKHHDLSQQPASATPLPLTTLELPFTYIEQEEAKSALVKVVLCGKCFDKLMWKRRKEKESQVFQGEAPVPVRASGNANANTKPEVADGRKESVNPPSVNTEEGERKRWGRKWGGENRSAHDRKTSRQRSSRSRSPRSYPNLNVRSFRRNSKPPLP